jgi:hypothetical protein
MIFNINECSFGGKMKMGDMIASFNILEFIREKYFSNDIKYYLPNNVIQDRDHVRKFRDFLINNSNYISNIPGEIDFPFGPYEIWSFREQQGERVWIDIPRNNEKIISIFPLIDAEYNTERNWPNDLFQDVLNYYKNYNDYEKVICVLGDIPKDIDYTNYKISNDFMINIDYAVKCKYYVGGDTGFSHFVSSLKQEDKVCKYLYANGQHGGWRSEFTAPFYVNGINKNLEFYNKNQI